MALRLIATLGNRVHTARANKSFTLEDLKTRTGLSKGFLSDIENDKRNPSASNVLILSDILDVSVEWLLRGKRVKPMKCPLCGKGTIEF